MRLLKRKLLNSIELRDTSFGISLNFSNLLPAWCETIYVEVKENGKRVSGKTLLPHQIYLEDLIEMSKGGKLDVIITPKYPERKSFNLFEGEK